MTHLNRVGRWFGAQCGQETQAQTLHVQQGIFSGGQRGMHLFQDLKSKEWWVLLFVYQYQLKNKMHLWRSRPDRQTEREKTNNKIHIWTNLLEGRDEDPLPLGRVLLLIKVIVVAVRGAD